MSCYKIMHVGFKILIILVVIGVIIGAAYLGFYIKSKQSEEDSKKSPAGVAAVPIDLPRYTGKWYEIARLPNEFEDFGETSCGLVTAEYEVITSGEKISVKNTCQISAVPKIANGHALVNSNGTLSVTFVPDPIPPIYGNYTCIYRVLGDAADDPWKTSVVVGGTDKVKYAWILHRSETMTTAELDAAKAALAAAGVDVSALIMTDQGM